MNLRHAVRQLGQAITQPRPQQPPVVLTMRLGTIKTVTAGAAVDGNAAVVVTVNGNDIPAPYVASYTPVVGHMVRVDLNGSSPVIVGQVIGLPSF